MNLNNKIRYFLIGIVLALGAGYALSKLFKSDELLIQGIESHFSVMGQSNAELIIGLIKNQTNQTENLVKIESPIAHSLIMYSKAKNDDGLMVEVEKLTLEPGDLFSSRNSMHGYVHVMLMDLKRPLIKNESVPVSFHFESGKVLEKRIKVLDTPEGDGGGHHH